MKFVCKCGNSFSVNLRVLRAGTECPLCHRTNLAQCKPATWATVKRALSESSSARPYSGGYEYPNPDHSGGKIPAYWHDVQHSNN